MGCHSERVARSLGAPKPLPQNQNANAIRFGTLYNFRFDADQPPQTANATVGFFKTGSPMMVAIQAPAGGGTPTPDTYRHGTPPTATATATATATPATHSDTEDQSPRRGLVQLRHRAPSRAPVTVSKK